MSPNEILLQAIIENLSVGKDKHSRSIVGEDMNVYDVDYCSFGSYMSDVKLKTPRITEGP